MQEVPSVTTAAYGTASVKVDPTTRVISGTITTANINGTAAHIHTGAVGASGVPVITLAAQASGVWKIPADTVLTQAQYDALLADGLYFNVHSLVHSNGEIRGQITKAQPLSGEQEVPPVMTAATGIGTFAMNPAASGGAYAIAGGIVTTGITGTAAHIHLGAAGASGVQVITLEAPASGVWAIPASAVLSSTERDAYLAGNLYFNVHSAANPDGEIRGQIVP